MITFDNMADQVRSNVTLKRADRIHFKGRLCKQIKDKNHKKDCHPLTLLTRRLSVNSADVGQ